MLAAWQPSVTVSVPPAPVLLSEKASVVCAPQAMSGRSMPLCASKLGIAPVSTLPPFGTAGSTIATLPLMPAVMWKLPAE